MEISPGAPFRQFRTPTQVGLTPTGSPRRNLAAAFDIPQANCLKLTCSPQAEQDSPPFTPFVKKLDSQTQELRALKELRCFADMAQVVEQHRQSLLEAITQYQDLRPQNHHPVFYDALIVSAATADLLDRLLDEDYQPILQEAARIYDYVTDFDPELSYPKLGFQVQVALITAKRLLRQQLHEECAIVLQRLQPAIEFLERRGGYDDLAACANFFFVRARMQRARHQQAEAELDFERTKRMLDRYETLRPDRSIAVQQDRAWVALELGWLAVHFGRFTTGLRQAEEVAASVRGELSFDNLNQAHQLLLEGACRRFLAGEDQPQLETALALLSQAQELCEQHQLRRFHDRCLWEKAWVLHLLKRSEEAIEILTAQDKLATSLTDALEGGPAEARAVSLRHLGLKVQCYILLTVIYQKKDANQAFRFANWAYLLATRTDLPVLQSEALLWRASVLDYRAAINDLELALSLLRRPRHPYHEAFPINASLLGLLHLRLAGAYAVVGQAEDVRLNLAQWRNYKPYVECQWVHCFARTIEIEQDLWNKYGPGYVAVAEPGNYTLSEHKRGLEAALLQKATQDAGGNYLEAAQELDISRARYYQLQKAHNPKLPATVAGPDKIKDKPPAGNPSGSSKTRPGPGNQFVVNAGDTPGQTENNNFPPDKPLVVTDALNGPDAENKVMHA